MYRRKGKSADIMQALTFGDPTSLGLSCKGSSVKKCMCICLKSGIIFKNKEIKKVVSHLMIGFLLDLTI